LDSASACIVFKLTWYLGHKRYYLSMGNFRKLLLVLTILQFIAANLLSAAAWWPESYSEADCYNTPTLLKERDWLVALKADMSQKLPAEKQKFEELKNEMAEQVKVLSNALAPTNTLLTGIYTSANSWEKSYFESEESFSERKMIAVKEKLKTTFQLNKYEFDSVGSDQMSLRDDLKDDRSYTGTKRLYKSLSSGLSAKNEVPDMYWSTEVKLGLRGSGAEDIKKALATFSTESR